MYLTGEKLKEKIKEGMVEDYVHLDTQINGNYFDLTVSEVSEIKGRGEVDFSDSERQIPETNPVKPRKKDPEDEYGWWMLPKGHYLAKTNEKLKVPKGHLAVLQPRLSLLKSGLDIPMRIVPEGEKKEIYFNIAVTTDNGFEIKENARLISTMFINLKSKNKYGGY